MTTINVERDGRTHVTRDIPIIFSGAMVRALLDGRKTMTRRSLKPQPEQARDDAGNLLPHGLMHIEGEPRPRITIGRVITWQQVRYAPGDRLYVRETHYRFGVWRGDGKTKTGLQRWRFKALSDDVMFLDAPPEPHRIGTAKSKGHPVGQWWKRPAIHMPRSLSRLTLLVTATKIEPLKDISHEDAVAEGCYRIEPCAKYPHGNAWGRAGFAALWDRLHGDGSFDKEPSPEVVALSFRVIKSNIDRIQEAA